MTTVALARTLRKPRVFVLPPVTPEEAGTPLCPTGYTRLLPRWQSGATAPVPLAVHTTPGPAFWWNRQDPLARACERSGCRITRPFEARDGAFSNTPTDRKGDFGGEPLDVQKSLQQGSELPGRFRL